MPHNPIFAFDFSMSKPAMCSYINEKIEFTVFTAHLDKTSQQKLEDANIIIYDRNLPTIKSLQLDENTLIMEHVTRASNLAKLISSTIISKLEETNNSIDNAYIVNEGFAFSARGDAMLDLSGYKYILINELINCGFTKFTTYSPISIKATAGCSKKGYNKDSMIEALYNEPEGTHTIIDIIKKDKSLLKKKTSYVTCMDDIADSYWCLKTFLKKNG